MPSYRKKTFIYLTYCAFAAWLFLASLPTVVSGAPIYNPNILKLVELGRVPPGIANQIEKDGEAEILLVLEDSDVQTFAARMRDFLHTRTDTPEIISEKKKLYKQKKKAVLARLGQSNYSILTDYDNFPVVHMRVNESDLLQLLSMPEVEHASEDRVVKAYLAQSLPLINAPQAHSSGATGAGTSVAVLDTGVNYKLSAFGNCTSPGSPSTCKVAYVQDFAPDDGSLDDDGHGTNVSAIVLGVAPDAQILGLDVFRTNGSAYYSDILSALNWVLSNKSTYNIQAVNMSLGGGSYSSPCPTDGLATAIGNLKSAGITTAVASGNEGRTNAISAPACIPTALSVGAVYDSNIGSVSYSSVPCSDATTSADKVTCFSNSASFLTMLAPGAAITAAGITMYGTSQATPHVAGAAAVVKSVLSTLTVDEVVSRLTSSGVAVTDSRNNITKPRLDLYGAVSAPHIGISPESHDFGNVSVGSSSAQSFTVSNTGTADLEVQSLALTGAAASEFALQNDFCSSQTLGPGGTCSAGVTFLPQSTGTKSASLSVPSNDPNVPSLAVSLTGTGTVPQFSLSVNKGGTGSGTVSSSPAGINCGADCTELYASGTVVTLTALPDSSSVFSGWSGGGCSGAGNCVLTLNANTTVTAAFDSVACTNPPVRLAGPIPVYYSSVQSAYNAASDGGTIQIQAIDLTENPSLDRPVSISLEGGFDCDFTSNESSSAIRGTLTVSRGTVTVDKIVIR